MIPIVLQGLLGVVVALPPSISLQSAAHHNRHATFGASGSKARAAVKIVFLSATKARLTDTGRESRYFSSADGRYRTRESTWWRARWEGRWSRRQNRLRFDLRLIKRSCQRTKSEPGRKTVKPCAPLGRRVLIRCRSGPVSVAGSPRPAWICESTGARERGRFLRWVFGKRACLRATGGRPGSGRLRYEGCAKGFRIAKP